MARLVNIWQGFLPPALEKKQMPLIIDKNLVIIMDISGLKALRETPLAQGRQLEEFSKKLNLLNMKEKKASFEVTCKDMLNVLDQSIPCIGCRRSVERLFYDLSNLNNHPALDPIIITSDGMLTIKDEVLESSQRLCTLLQGHSTRLNDLVEQQPRSKKSRRCTLHSLEVQRMKPPPNAWREVWDCMENDCLKEITSIDADTLDITLDTYLRKHKFCSECRTKVILASSLLTTDSDPTKEKGYVSSLYADIKRCTSGHVHLPLNIDYISSIIGRAQPDLMGRERHAKTLEIAQEEVLTCLGICIAERLNRIFRRLKEEEIIVKVLAAVAVNTLSRNFQMAIEYKHGVNQLEVLYKEFKREEVAKQQRREKLRLKKKKKKERRLDIEEKENKYKEKESNCKLRVFDTKNKSLQNCNCTNCVKRIHYDKIQFMSKPLSNLSKNREKKIEKKNAEFKKINSSIKKACKHDKIDKSLHVCTHKSSESSNIRKTESYSDSNESKNSTNEHLIDALIDTNKRYTMWIEVKKCLNTKVINRNYRSSSENSSRDYGYSSEHNVSSSSLPSTPEGSEVACSDGCCNHESDYSDRSVEKFIHSDSSFCILKTHGVGLTLSEMLEDSCLSEDEDNCSYIPVEEILEFKSRMCQVTKKRQELRQTLKKRFALLCNHKSLSIPR